ncbi:MAG: hypothetical protein RDU83_13420 [bacterium]|nr:hypothetical protein [bacterium]
MVRAAALVVRAMEERGLFPVVVGGTAVAIYTEGREWIGSSTGSIEGGFAWRAGTPVWGGMA